MERGAAIMQKDRLELDSCCVNVDIDPVSITYCDQVPSLPWPAPLPVRTLLFSTSAAAQLQRWWLVLLIQPIKRTRKPLYADWTNKSGHSDCTFINGQKCCLCWLMILSFKRIWNSKLEPHWAAFVCQHELQCTSTLFRYSEVKFGHRMFPHHKWMEENLKRALQQEMGAVFQYFSI